MTKKALLIGINYYKTPQSKLNGCIDDVVNMRNMLIDAYAYELSNMTVLRDDTNDNNILPTRQNMINALNSLIADSFNCTEIWFHYSGHGAKVQNTNTPADSIIVPCDYLTAGIILDNDLYAILKNVKCRCFLLFDSCNSGNVVELPWSYQYMSLTQIVKTNINNHILENTEIYMYSGCKDNQTSVDIYSNDLQDYVGAFTNAFIICLRMNNHNVDLLKLYTDICFYLANNNFSQIPTFSSTLFNTNYTLMRQCLNSTTPTNSIIIPTKDLIIIPKITRSINLSKMILY